MATTALLLVENGVGWQLGQVTVEDGNEHGTDLTRMVRCVEPGTAVVTFEESRTVEPGDLEGLAALGMALNCADLVGIMRGAIDISVDYAKERKQYGVAVGSFQAVQHLLAEALVLLEGSMSVAAHAAWAVDNLEAPLALQAGRVAKAYCARAARTVCETAVQVHGGIGNTWECMVHVYLRRALLSSALFGDDGAQLRELGIQRLRSA